MLLFGVTTPFVGESIQKALLRRHENHSQVTSGSVMSTVRELLLCCGLFIGLSSANKPDVDQAHFSCHSSHLHDGAIRRTTMSNGEGGILGNSPHQLGFFLKQQISCCLTQPQANLPQP